MKQHLWLAAVLCTMAVRAVAQTDGSAAAAPRESAFQSTVVVPTGQAVVRINGTVLTDRDLIREMMALFPYARQHGGRIPKTMEADIRQGALRMLEFEELVYQEAERRKITLAPGRLDRAVQDFQTSFSSEEEFREYLQAELQNSLPRLRQQVRRSLLIEELLKAEVTRRAVVGDSEVRAYYDKNRARFQLPEMVAIQTISLVIPDQAGPEVETSVRRKAEEALRQARAAKSYEQFGMLAEKISDDDWRVMMGDHHLISREKMPPEVAKVAFIMQPAQVSDLIRTENSWCIVRLNRHQPARLAPFEQVKAGLKKELQALKVEDLRGALHRQLRKNAIVEEL